MIKKDTFTNLSRIETLVYMGCFIGVIIFINPSSSPLISLLFFLLVWRIVTMLFVSIFNFKSRIKRSDVAKEYNYALSHVVAFCVTLLAIFSSMHQLKLLDIGWCLLLLISARFYFKRTILANSQKP